MDRGTRHNLGVGGKDDDARRVLEQARGQRRRAQLMASVLSYYNMNVLFPSRSEEVLSDRAIF